MDGNAPGDRAGVEPERRVGARRHGHDVAVGVDQRPALERGADGGVVLDALRRDVGDEALADRPAAGAESRDREDSVAELHPRGARRPVELGRVGPGDDEHGEVVVLLPRPEGGLQLLVTLPDEHRRARLTGGGPHGGVRGEQVGLGGVGGDHEGRADRRLAGVVERMDEPDRGSHLLEEGGERLTLGGDLLQRRELLVDLLLGVVAGLVDRRRGVLEPLLDVGDVVRHSPLVLVEPVVVVGVEHGAAERSADRRDHEEHRHSQHTLGQQPLAPTGRDVGHRREGSGK